MNRSQWSALGGADERFDLAGGGLLNLDLFRRAIELPGAELVTLLGEGTFHQLHGGVATNSSVDSLQKNWTLWAKQYELIRGRPYTVPKVATPRIYLGTFPRAVLARFARAAIAPVWVGDDETEVPLGRNFELDLWSFSRTPRPARSKNRCRA